MLAVITVDSLADNANADGQITLREAILAANTDSVADAVEGVQAGSGADSIVFSSSLNGGTILLTIGELPTISMPVGIDASSLINGLTIDAGDGSDNVFGTADGNRVVSIDDGTGANIDVELRGLTLTGGDVGGDGGAIMSFENVSLVDSVVTGNAASNEGGGVYVRLESGGQFNIENTAFSFNEGEHSRRRLVCELVQ